MENITHMTRRRAIATTLLTGVALSSLQNLSALSAATPAPAAASGPFTLPPLGYGYDALEPFIDAQTMQIHHDKHHAAYIAKLNDAVNSVGGDTAKMSIESLLTGLDSLPESIRTAVRNHGGGHYNHSLFWQMLKVDGGKPSEAFSGAIENHFGSLDSFWEEFGKAAGGQFGSGWAWLVVGRDKNLSVVATANQDSPISAGATVLLGIDVWEHAYYLKYQNKRADYVKAFRSVVNWDFVNTRFVNATA